MNNQSPTSDSSPSLGDVLKHLHDQEVSWGLDFECCGEIAVHVGKHFEKPLFDRSFKREEFDEIAAWMLESGEKVRAMERELAAQHLARREAR